MADRPMRAWARRRRGRIGVCALGVLTAALAACAADEPRTARTPDVPALGANAGPVAGAAQAGVGAVAGVMPVAGAAGSAVPAVPQDVAAAGASGAAAGATAGAAAGAVGVVGGAEPTAGMMGAAGEGEPAAGAIGAAGTSGAAGTAGTDPPVTGDLCERWTTAHANLSEGAWNGNAATCDPGDMSAEARASALALVNLYRSMAGIAPVEMTDESNRLAQACALMMNANGRISHTPSASWECYTQEAADTAGSSSLSNAAALESVDGYMVDPGNPTTLGHRRWILSNLLSGIGFGSTGDFSCQYQPANWRPGGVGVGAAWVAWPPPGQVPIQVLATSFFTIDRTGWSVQSDSIDLGGAQVSVTSQGVELPVSVTPLLPGYGSNSALSILPMGWTTEAGKSYRVDISGTSTPIGYDVEVVDCR